MANLDAAKKLFKAESAMLPRKAIDGAVRAFTSGFAENNAGAIDLSKIQIPYFTTDSDVLQVIKELGLKDPQKMIRFMVEWHFENLQCIIDGFNEMKDIDLINSYSLIEGSKLTYEQALANTEDKKYLLNTVTQNLNVGFSQLKEKAKKYINQIKDIDNRSRITFFRNAKRDYNKVVADNKLAKAAVDLAVEAVNINILISEEFGWSTDTVIRNFEKFKKELISEDNCMIMHDYDIDKKDEFWLKLPERLDNAINTAELLKEFIDNTEEEDYDFDHIEFN